MQKLFGGTVHSALVHALTVYDRRQERYKHYNPYALGQYLIRLEQVELDITEGTPIRTALIAGFCGRILDCTLKAVGEPKATDKEVSEQLLIYSRR